MDDRTFLLGKLAALEAALEAALSTHPEPGMLAVALCEAMTRQSPTRHGPEIRAFAEGWLAIVTPLLTLQAGRAKATRPTPQQAPMH